MLENYSGNFNVKCQLDTCKNYPTVTDFERGEIVCMKCGSILLQKIWDMSSESNTFSQESYMKSTRTGPNISLTMHDKGLSTVIGSNKDSCGIPLSNKSKYEFNRLRKWDQRSQSRKTASLSKAFTLLHAMKSKLGIPNNVVEKTAYIYRKVVNAKLTRGRTMKSLISASLYAACRESGIPRTLDDIAIAGNVEKKILSRDLRTIIKKLELNLNQYDTTTFISKISNNLNLKEKTKRDAFEIFYNCEKNQLTAGKHPVAQAAAAIYVSCMINKEKISQSKISAESGVSSVTIRNRVNSIRKIMKIVD